MQFMGILQDSAALPSLKSSLEKQLSSMRKAHLHAQAELDKLEVQTPDCSGEDCAVPADNLKEVLAAVDRLAA